MQPLPEMPCLAPQAQERGGRRQGLAPAQEWHQPPPSPSRARSSLCQQAGAVQRGGGILATRKGAQRESRDSDTQRGCAWQGTAGEPEGALGQGPQRPGSPAAARPWPSAETERNAQWRLGLPAGTGERKEEPRPTPEGVRRLETDNKAHTHTPPPWEREMEKHSLAGRWRLDGGGGGGAADSLPTHHAPRTCTTSWQAAPRSPRWLKSSCPAPEGSSRECRHR